MPPSPTVWDCTPPDAIRSHVLGLTSFVGGVYGRRMLQCLILYLLDPPISLYLSPLPLFYLVKTYTTSTSALLLYLLYTTTSPRLRPHLAALCFANRPESLVQLPPLLLPSLLKSPLKLLASFFCSSLLTYSLTVLYDSYHYGVFLVPAWNYIKYNLTSSHSHGTQPFYATPAHFFMLYGPAATVSLCLELKNWASAVFRRLGSGAGIAAVPSADVAARRALIAVTLAMHAAVGHKETRFLSPLALFIVCDYGPGGGDGGAEPQRPTTPKPSTRAPAWAVRCQVAFGAVMLPVMMLHHRGEMTAVGAGVDCLQGAYPVKGARWLEEGEGWEGSGMVGTRRTPDEVGRGAVDWFWSLDLDDGFRTKLYVYDCV